MCSAADKRPLGDTLAIEVRGLSFSYGDEPLIDRFDLCIEKGCVTGLVGPNGCGKSTLLKLVSGLLEPRGGSIVVDGRVVAGLRHKERARLVSMMPQETPAVPMSVYDLALCGRYAHMGPLRTPSAVDRAAVDRALEMAGLGASRNRLVDELSGGQRQRAYFAMMLAQQTDTMLLDEPTSALDIGAAHEVLSLVRAVQRRHGSTVVVVLHDLDLALRYCDEIAVMDGGALVVQAAPCDVVASGVLETVFNVQVRTVETDLGPSWSFYPRM